MGWSVAPSLIQLRNEVDARWPGRKKSHDGTIGDRSHQRRRSAHNPDNNGVVRAIDITNLPGSGTDELVEMAKRDPRVYCVISRGYIYSAKDGFRKRVKTGDKHMHHVHISIWNRVEAGSMATSQRLCDALKPGRWFGAHAEPDTATGVTVAELLDNRTTSVRAVQKALNAVMDAKLTTDGVWGPKTHAAYQRWQEHLGFTGADADGVPGLTSLRRLAAKYGGFRVVA